MGCLYFCGVNAIGQIYCDEKGTCYLNPEWLIKKVVPELNEYPEFIIATTAPTPKPTTKSMVYVMMMVILIFVKSPAHCGGTRMDVSITNLRIIGNLKLAMVV